MLENPNIVLSGFMATGKTSVGRELARLTGFNFVDADQILEERLGLKISDIFRNNGEEKFREEERTLAFELSLKRNMIIATGGGMILDRESRDALESSGELFCLNASVDTIRRRVGGSKSRPLLSKKDSDRRIITLLEERKAVYGSIEQQVDTDQLPPDALAIEILSRLSPPIRRQTVTTSAGGSYPILFGRGTLKQLPELLSSHLTGGDIFVITDSNVVALHGDNLKRILEEAGFNHRIFVFPAGESSKTMATVTGVHSYLAGASAQRDATLVAFGGGVVGDVAGFAASTYMRGISLVHIPTTLMAQGDSSIGGKNAVNTVAAKNLIGTFYHPQFVLTDPELLLTLPDREYRSGFAEVVKTAIIEGEDAFHTLEILIEQIRDRFIALLAPVLFRCIQQKAQIVSRDPYEQNERKVLNLGHTFGHAIEQGSNYTGVSHGEAVALGIRTATAVSLALGIISGGEAARIIHLLDEADLLETGGAQKKTNMIKTMLLDKKARRGKLTIVVPARIGEIETIEGIEPSRLIEILEEADEKDPGDPRTQPEKAR